MPTEKQVSAAFDAWEDESRKWRIRNVDPYWLVERRIDGTPPDAGNKPIEDDIAFYKYRDEAAARLFVRDKIIRAVLTAVETLT